MLDTVECPKCGRKSLVHRRDELYQCLACDFKRDLSDVDVVTENQSGMQVIWLLVLGLIMTLMVAGQQPNYRPNPEQFPNTQNPQWLR